MIQWFPCQCVKGTPKKKMIVYCLSWVWVNYSNIKQCWVLSLGIVINVMHFKMHPRHGHIDVIAKENNVVYILQNTLNMFGTCCKLSLSMVPVIVTYRNIIDPQWLFQLDKNCSTLFNPSLSIY